MGAISTLTLDIIGRSDKLRAELKKAGKHTKSWGEQTRRSVNTGAKAFAGMGVASGLVLAAVYTDSAKAADAVGKLSDAIGEAPEKVMALGHAAEITGVGADKMNKALQKQVKSLGEAANGTGEAKRYLDQLGLSNKAFFSLSPADQFAKISDKVNGLSTQQEKAAAASAIYGREGVKLLNTMALGSDGLSEMAAEAEALGLTLTRIDIAKVEAANDAFYRAKETTSAFGKQLAVEASPMVKALSDQFLKAAKEAGGFGQIAEDVVDGVVDGVGFAADSVHLLTVAWATAKQGVFEFVNMIFVAANELAQMGGGFSDALGIDRASLEKSSQTFFNMTMEMRDELNDLAMSEYPSAGIERWVREAREQADKAAKEVAANSKKNQGQSYDPDTSEEDAKAKAKADAKAAKLKTENDKIVSLHREKFRSIWEVNLEAQGKHAELQQMQHAKQLEEFEQERARLTERGLMTAELNAQFNVMEIMAAQTHAAELKRIDDESNAAKLESRRLVFEGASQLFEGMAGLTAAFGKKQSGAYKVMFAASKAFAVAEAAVKIQQGIAQAWSLGFPAGIPAAATVMSNAASIVPAISGTNYAGAYAAGGVVPGNSKHGDNLWARVNSGETILTNQQAGNVVSMLDHKAANKAPTVNIYGAQNAEGAQVDFNPETNELDIFLSDINSGGPRAQAIEQRYGLTAGGWK